MLIDKAYKLLKERIPSEGLLLNEPMAKHTSFKIGGPADILVLPTSEDEILHTLKICEKFSIPLFVMGNGSNLLVRDKGIRGVVLKIGENYSKIRVEGTKITAEAGILLSTLAKTAVRNGLKGLEFACGIPGTLGGATTMNAGAYGGEMKNVIVSVKGVNKKGKFLVLANQDMNFGYRKSYIQENQFVVLEVVMELEYGDQKESLALINELAKKRREKQPLTYPSAGSTFKRPVGYYAGKLIQDCGLKGLRIGDAQISELHAGFIINLGKATAKDVIELIKKVQETIFEKYNVKINPEVRIIGEE